MTHAAPINLPEPEGEPVEVEPTLVEETNHEQYAGEPVADPWEVDDGVMDSGPQSGQFTD
jgi:hypothetical protein